MNTHELPLVLFTVMGQMSVGCFVVLGALHLFFGRRAERLSEIALYAIGPVMVLAMMISVLHLGNPVNALHSIEHLGSSWLSREIFFGSSFAGLGAAFALCQWRKWFPPLLRQLLAGVTALVGLVFVYSMSMVYMLPTVPGWDSWATPVTFFTTTFLLGSLAVGTALVLARRPDDEIVTVAVRWVGVAALVLLGVEFVVFPTYALQLTGKGPAGVETADALLYGGGSMLILRLILVFAGAGLLGLLLRRRVMAYTVIGAFGLVLASELIGRLLFYSSMTQIGI
jgi:anaerobic dimethyl sulfoxide reductase subunit C (anchor subunit)